MENQWQPIETAPKDGSKFLMFITGVKYTKYNDGRKYRAKTIQTILIAQYSVLNEFKATDNNLTIYIDKLNYKDEHDLSLTDYYVKYDIQATHWMPLPKPPVINN